MSTRSAIINLMVRRLGGWTGAISSGTATTAVIDRVGTTGDDTLIAGDIFWMLDAANETDKDRRIEEWDDSEGQVKWIKDRADTTYTAETYCVMPGQGEASRFDFYTALNDVLGRTRRTVVSILPTVNDERVYRLGNLSWVRHRGDIDAVFYRPSPNFVDNAQFDNWKDGSASAPTRWTLAGSGATVARTSSNLRKGYYGATLTRVGADATLTQTIGLLNGQLAGKSVTFEVEGLTSTASVARIGISDGLTTTYSSYHTGGGGIETLSVTKTLSSSATTLQVILSVDTTNAAATFSHAASEEASAISSALSDTGDSAYRLQEVSHEIREQGGVPVIELASAKGRGGQLVIYSGQPYPSLSADSGSTDCPDAVIVPGALYELGRKYAKGRLYERYEKIAEECGREYSIAASRQRQVPVPQAQNRVLVRGA